MIRKMILAAMTVAAAGMTAAAASAAVPLCLTDGSVTGAVDCRGYFVGQIIDGNQTDRDTQLGYLQEMGFTGTVPASLFSGTDFNVTGLSGLTSLSFAGAPTLFGDTFIGIHWGGGATGGGGQSAIYEFNFTAPVSSITIMSQNPGGSSNAVLYSTGGVASVPEPASWALMIAGLLMTSYWVRRRTPLTHT